MTPPRVLVTETEAKRCEMVECEPATYAGGPRCTWYCFAPDCPYSDGREANDYFVLREREKDV